MMKEVDNTPDYEQASPSSFVGEEKGDELTDCHQGRKDDTQQTNTAPRELEFATLLKCVIIPACGLIVFPLSFYTNGAKVLPYEQRSNAIQDIVTVWESLLHVSIWLVLPVASIAAFILAHSFNLEGCARSPSGCVARCFTKNKERRNCCRRWPLGVTGTVVFCLALCFSVGATIQSQLQVITPSWLWNPFLWGSYTVFSPEDISGAIRNVCVDGDRSVEEDSEAAASPLCLPESSWNELSSGFLSSHNAEDVDAVRKGLRVARQDSFGLAIAVLARDTADSLQALRANMEGLVPFVSKLSVVVFENDSKDGTREAFMKWRSEVEGSYIIDIIDCEEAPDCVFGVSHRYDSTEAKDYFKSSAIGRMAEFRQRIIDYVTSSSAYSDYSHILVMDVDLGVSLSPLGLLHALGKKPDAAIASAARQAWPGSFGSLTPQYDFSAFRAIETPRNRRILWLHQKFCGLAPAGDRWRNMCDAVSPMHFMLVSGHEKGSGTEPYPVASAFNGATLYPIRLIRETGARYDSGDDGQRCEHIGFNLSLKKPTFVDPKWMMNLKPVKPGGPTGTRALKSVMRIVFTPSISFPIFFQNLGCMILFIYCIMMVSMHLVYPLWLKILAGTRFKEAAFCADQIVFDKSGSELDLFMSRKRKISDLEQLAKTV